MHQLYFVVHPRMEEARGTKEFIDLENPMTYNKAAYKLLEENDFVSQSSGYFSGGPADWFVVGGRWSGILYEALGYEILADVSYVSKEVERYKRLRVIPGNAIYNFSDEDYSKLLDEIVNEKLSAYEEHGYHHDSMVLTQELYNTLRIPYDCVDCFVQFIGGDLDEQQLRSLESCLREDYVITVIDYHC